MSVSFAISMSYLLTDIILKNPKYIEFYRSSDSPTFNGLNKTLTLKHIP